MEVSISFLFYMISYDHAAITDEEVDDGSCFKVGDAVADHDDRVGVEALAPLADDRGFAAVAGGWIGFVEAGIGAVWMEEQRDGLKGGDVEEVRERADDWLEAAGEDDRGPTAGAEGGEGLVAVRFDALDIGLGDLLANGEGRLDDIEAAGKDILDGDLAIHGGIGEGLDLGENRGSAQAREFIDAFDGREG